MFTRLFRWLRTAGTGPTACWHCANRLVVPCDNDEPDGFDLDGERVRFCPWCRGLVEGRRKRYEELRRIADFR